MLWTLGACLLAGRPANAQDPQAPPPSPQIPLPAPRGDDMLLEAAVNRAQYQLGPGDVVTVSITGNVNRVWQLPVSPEGTVVVPELGVVPVLDLNLNQAQVRVRDLVLRFYQGVGVSLTLSEARRFRVFVAGNVPAPGSRVATPATRVSDLIPTDDVSGVVRRNVVVRRAGGDSIMADLVRFRLTGELDANPFLRQGDVVVVPRPDRTVEVYGRVHFPGNYEFRQGETLAELLRLVNGGGAFPASAADSLRISRFVGGNEREFMTFSRADALGPAGRGFPLRPGDAVYVAEMANFQVQRTALVLGQVVRPGRYPIRPDTTTVRELVAMAGGFTERASLVEATLRRQAAARDTQGIAQLQSVPPELLTTEERLILQTRSLGDPNAVVIDFQRLFAQGESALDQPVEANDVLTVPERRFGVTVLGAVAQPGIVRHAPGLAVSDYIRGAGGYVRRADRDDVTVIRARLGSRVDARDVRQVEAGDQIIVPFRRRRDPLQTLQTAQVIVGTISGLIFSYIALRPVLFPDDDQ